MGTRSMKNATKGSGRPHYYSMVVKATEVFSMFCDLIGWSHTSQIIMIYLQPSGSETCKNGIRLPLETPVRMVTRLCLLWPRWIMCMVSWVSHKGQNFAWFTLETNQTSTHPSSVVTPNCQFGVIICNLREQRSNMIIY